MNSAIIDNAIGADITRCITWQFDKAARLVGIITALKDFYDQSTGELWDGIIGSVENIDEANDYGFRCGERFSMSEGLSSMAEPLSSQFHLIHIARFSRVASR